MQKQELIDKYTTMLSDVRPYCPSRNRLIEEAKFNLMMDFISDLRSLEGYSESSQIALPRAVAKYLDFCIDKDYDFTEEYSLLSWETLDSLNHEGDFYDSEVEFLQDWFFDNSLELNRERHIQFLQAWTGGYMIEPDPSYIIMNVQTGQQLTGCYIANNGTINTTFKQPSQSEPINPITFEDRQLVTDVMKYIEDDNLEVKEVH